MTELIVLFVGLMSHVAGEGDRAAVLINASGHEADLRIPSPQVRTPIPAALAPSLEENEYRISLAGFRVTTNVGVGSPELDASVEASVPALSTISACRQVKTEVLERTASEDISAYFVYRGGTLTVSAFEYYGGRFDVWPEERCIPHSLEYRIAAQNVELIFTRLSDNATWTFGVVDGAQLTVGNRSTEAGHFHHQYKIFNQCTGPSPVPGDACSHVATRTATKVARMNINVECVPSMYP